MHLKVKKTVVAKDRYTVTHKGVSTFWNVWAGQLGEISEELLGI